MPVAPAPLLWLAQILTCAVLAVILDMLSAMLSMDTLAVRCSSHLSLVVGSLWWGSPWGWSQLLHREVQVLMVSSGEADYLTLWGSRTLQGSGTQGCSSQLLPHPESGYPLNLYQELTRSRSPTPTLTDPAGKRPEHFLQSEMKWASLKGTD